MDLVIDHHPVERPIKAHIKDVRPTYGATSTILVEYLRAADVKISQRLATALLYGIKSDTLGLERGGTKADLDAFAYLYLLANHNALRRIERPELSETALDVLAQGLARRRIAPRRVLLPPGIGGGGRPRAPVRRLRPAGGGGGVVGGVGRGRRGCPHLDPQRGLCPERGRGRRATAFGDLGSAGGHRTMAKAVIPLERLADAENGAGRALQDRVIQRFLRALGHQRQGVAAVVIIYLIMVLVGAATAIFAIQNTDPVVIRFLGWRIEGMPLALVILLSALAGLLFATMVASSSRSASAPGSAPSSARSRRPPPPPASAPPGPPPPP